MSGGNSVIENDQFVRDVGAQLHGTFLEKSRGRGNQAVAGWQTSVRVVSSIDGFIFEERERPLRPA